MDKIVAAIDFSPASAAVVAQAAALARLGSATVVLVHAAAPDPEFVGYDVGPQYRRDARADTLRRERQALKDHAENLREEGIDAMALLVEGLTVETILSVAEDQNADLIVVGSHGLGAVARAFLGSVSSGVVHRSKIPVLVVPMPGRGEKSDD